MDAVASVPTDWEDAAWRDAIGAVNAWRGHALHCFSHAESAVSETLLVLSRVPGRGTGVRLRHLLGQKLDDLHSAVTGDGPFAVEGEAASTALAAFREHEELRQLLAHGVAKVWLGREAEWLVVLSLLSFRRRMAERTARSFDQQQAQAVLADLKRCASRLSAVLGSLRVTVAS